MKLIKLLLCTFVLTVSIFSMPSTAVEAKVGGNVKVSQLPTAGPNITWTLNNGTLTISGSGEMSEYYSPQHYPWYDKRASINRVVINSGITNIPTYIFGNGAYPNLTSVSIPGTVKKIGSFAFHASGLKEVVIPNGVETLDESVFINCPNLTKVTIAPSVKAIGISAFEGCGNLQQVHIQDLRAWVNIKFGSFYSNPLEKGKKLYLNGSLVTRVDIPAGVTKIADFAFVNCDSIQVVNMPASVTEIGNHSFQNAAGLHTVNAGGVTSVGSYGFGGSGQLRNVTLSPNLSYIGEYGFAYTPISSIAIKRGIIDDYAFIGCGLLTTVNMGAGVNYIGQGAFENCAALLPPHGKSVYTGTQAQFNAIPKETGNDILNRAAFTYTGREAAATPYKAKETIKLGSYYQSNSTTKEPIEWIVLKREGRYALVVSKYILYVDRFNNSYDLYNYPTTTDWANTTMREKLNTTFYNEAFSAEDKKKIAQRSISISNNTRFGTAGGSASNDHVFLLSEEEVKNYFENDMERKAEATQYAIKKARSEYGEGPNEKGGSYYWLRNSGLTKMNKQYVHNSGMVDEIGMATTNTITGVRPALWIELYSAETVSKVEEFVTRLYQLCLNRNPDANGKAYWVNSLLNKEITAAGAA
ncbi:MAG: leucine-rich repeat protein, partial [Solobacterium sp.]|nr:leucine-rich repeat protein [Solobacterium sp.]